MSEDAAAKKAREEEVVKVLRQFSGAFQTFDTDSFISTWDQSMESIVYQPEELRHPILSLKDLRAYFDNVPNVVKKMHDIRVIDFDIDIDGDVAIVYARFWCRIAFAKVVETADGQIRQSFILRRRDGEWKIVHYHESRQAPGFEQAVGDW